MIQRTLKLSKSQSFFLLGPRGSGKSTLLKQHFLKDQTLWLDLLDQQLEFELSQNPNLLLNKWEASGQPSWVVIDEVQKIPRLLDVVHKGIEEHKIKFALTGSSARKLKRGNANMLGGRASSFHLLPFSALELQDKFSLQNALSFGLLPRLWTEGLNNQEKTRALYSYVNTYLKEEIAAEQLVRNLNPFRKFLIAAAQSNSQIINYSKIDRDAGISHSQSQRHFEILSDTLIGRFLEPYHTSIRKRQSQKSKFYFFDTGVVRALLNLAGETLPPSTYEYGNLFETFVINEFFKLSESLEKRWHFSYLRTKDSIEIDLIIEKPRSKPILIEIKSTDKISQHDISSFLKITKEFKDSPSYVLSRTPEAVKFNDTLCLHWKEGIKRIFELT